MSHTRKRANLRRIIPGFKEVFKQVSVKRTSVRNLFLTVMATIVSKTFRINEIASCLPIDVKKEKSKQKRLLRFLDTLSPYQIVMKAWLAFVVRHLWRSKGEKQEALSLIDETDLLGG